LIEDNKLGVAATNQEKYSIPVFGEVWLYLYAYYMSVKKIHKRCIHMIKILGLQALVRI
jgi:hypothetical protein